MSKPLKKDMPTKIKALYNSLNDCEPHTHKVFLTNDFLNDIIKNKNNGIPIKELYNIGNELSKLNKFLNESLNQYQKENISLISNINFEFEYHNNSAEINLKFNLLTPINEKFK